MNRGLLHFVLVLALGGCFEAAPEQNLLPIDGELRIELPIPAANEEGIKPEVFVFLGDGTRHLQRLGETGRVIFSDASLRGPQDITVVWSYPKSDKESSSRVEVYTALEVNRSETYLTPEYPRHSPPHPAAGTISGRVTGLSDDPHAAVQVKAFVGEDMIGWAGKALHGTPFPEGIFEFSMDLASKPDGEVYLVANEMSASASFSTHRAGIIKAVAIDGTVPASVEIPVSEVRTERVTVDVGDGPREGLWGSVVIAVGGITLLQTQSEVGSLPIEVSAIAQEGAWSGFSRFATLGYSPDVRQWSCAAAPLGKATSARIDVLEFPVITTPSFPLSGEPVTVPANEPFAMTWHTDPRATAVRIYLKSEEEAGATRWRIDAPASRRAFRVRPLPESLAHLKLEMKGGFLATIISMKSERIATYSERFVRLPENVDGCVPLEDGSQTFAMTSGRFIRE